MNKDYIKPKNLVVELENEALFAVSLYNERGGRAEVKRHRFAGDDEDEDEEYYESYTL